MTSRFDSSGRHVGYLLFSKDILKEAPSPQSEEKFRSFIESAPDAIVIVNAEGRIILVNSQFEKLFGYSRAEALGQRVELLVPQRYRDRHPVLRTQYFQEPRVRPMGLGIDLFALHKDGHEIPVEISLSPLETEEGTLVSSSIRDVSVRKKIEASVKWQAQMLDLANDTIMIRNLNDEIIYWNKGAERLYGWTRDDAVGQRVADLLATTYPVSKEVLFGALYRDGRWEGELVQQTRNGQSIVVASRWTLQYDELGLPSVIVEINNDITDRKFAERALQEKNLELERASQTKDRFLATMSHELRTPLNAIIGFTGTMLMKLPGPLTADQEKQLRIVQSSARHLLTLINDLLDLSKIESGKVEINLEAVQCRSVVEEVARTLRPLAEAKGLGFEATVEPAELGVHADRRALSQILINLAGNAIKFTESGRVRICARKQDGVPRWIEIDVADTGVGISPEDQERLFRPFSQVNSAHRRRGEGTGLGLHLSRKLAELLDGRITLVSAPGEGSTFTIHLKEA